MSAGNDNQQLFIFLEEAFAEAAKGNFETAANLLNAAGSLDAPDLMQHTPHMSQWGSLTSHLAQRMRYEQSAQEVRDKVRAPKEQRITPPAPPAADRDEARTAAFDSVVLKAEAWLNRRVLVKLCERVDVQPELIEVQLLEIVQRNLIVAFDLSKTTYVTAANLRLLQRLSEAARLDKKRVALVGASEAVMESARVIEAEGLLWYPDVGSAFE